MTDVLYRVELFGELRVVQGNRVHTRFRTHKAANLLAYLALNHPQAHPRERLVELFWPDKERDVGRDGLSTALSQLRRQLETNGAPAGSLISADRQEVRLNPDTVSTDIADFARLLRQAKAATERSDQAELLQKAVDLYRGELLPGTYEEWASHDQTHYQSLALDSLRQLTRLHEEMEQHLQALTAARKVIAADPYAEDSCRAQMRLLVRMRQPSAALQVYAELERRYKEDLGTLPSASTRQMAETIRQDPQSIILMRAETAAAQHVARATSQQAQGPPPVVPKIAAMSPATPMLPRQATRFFGRECEREQLANLLQTPGVRLVSILGLGGAGKTRLAIEVAAQVAATFANRVWFVSLADIPDASLIAPTLIHSLNLPADDQSDLVDRVVTYLGEAPCLLVLDNLEHLLRDPALPGKSDNPALSSGVAVIRILLERVPGLVCLATSRHPLHLGGEQEFYLPSLSLPVQTDTVSQTDAVSP